MVHFLFQNQQLILTHTQYTYSFYPNSIQPSGITCIESDFTLLRMNTGLIGFVQCFEISAIVVYQSKTIAQTG